MASGLEIARWLAARRLVLYLGGLAVIVAVRTAPDAVGHDLSGSVESAMIGFALAILVVTYLAERAVRSEPDERVTRGRASYTTGQRLGVTASLAGFAVGGFFAITGRLLVAGPFLIGAALILQWVFDDESPGERADGPENRG